MKYSACLVDGDIIINKAAFAAETRWYTVGDLEFKYKKDADEYAKICKGTIEKHKNALPEHIVFRMIDQLLLTIKNNIDFKELRIIIGPPTGSITFRHEAAVTKPYKGNRKKEDRPIHIKAARQYIHNKYNAIIAYDMEADDLLGILQEEKKTIIASIDKDLLQIPGYHYNIDTKEVILSHDPGELWLTKRKSGKSDLRGFGFIWFCAQMLLGDAIDNISKPKKGLGSKKVYNYLKDSKSIREMWDKVELIYSQQAVIEINENATLLWILRDHRLSSMDRDHSWMDIINSSDCHSANIGDDND